MQAQRLLEQAGAAVLAAGANRPAAEVAAGAVTVPRQAPAAKRAPAPKVLSWEAARAAGVAGRWAAPHGMAGLLSLLKRQQKLSTSPVIPPAINVTGHLRCSSLSDTSEQRSRDPMQRRAEICREATAVAPGPKSLCGCRWR